MTDDNVWIYIERTQTREKILKLGRNYLSKNNVLVLEFNKVGIVVKKDFFNKDNMENIKFAKTVTVNELKKENFIYSFLSSIRTKMEGKKK
jgi:outer membrane protein assembly factor BamE (lipoprotein component of BamABCDE complex)